MQIVLQPSMTRSRSVPVAKTMVLYIVFLVPGVFLTLFALSLYPVLDTRTAMGGLLSVYLFAAVLFVIGIVRNQPGADSSWLRWIIISASVALVLLGCFILANGALDRSGAREVRSTVLEKAVVRGRYGAVQYRLFVTSWRPGVSREDLNVAASVFNRTAVGKPVTVTLHQGFFGIPWHGSVSPPGDEPNSN
jgi:hypothetical protein